MSDLEGMELWSQYVMCVGGGRRERGRKKETNQRQNDTKSQINLLIFLNISTQSENSTKATAT